MSHENIDDTSEDKENWVVHLSNNDSAQNWVDLQDDSQNDDYSQNDYWVNDYSQNDDSQNDNKRNNDDNYSPNDNKINNDDSQNNNKRKKKSQNYNPDDYYGYNKSQKYFNKNNYPIKKVWKQFPCMQKPPINFRGYDYWHCNSLNTKNAYRSRSNAFVCVWNKFSFIFLF